MRDTMSRVCGHPVPDAECVADLCHECAVRAAGELVGKSFETEPGGLLVEVRAADEAFVAVEVLSRAGGVYRWHSSMVRRMTRVA